MTTDMGRKRVVHRYWDTKPPVADYGEGIYLYDKEGNRYIDGASGSSVVPRASPHQ